MLSGGSEGLPSPNDGMVWFQAWVSLEASNPMVVDSLELVEQKKERYSAYGWEPTFVEDFHTQYYYFEIPLIDRKGKRGGRLVASTRDKDHASGEFYISW